jgi:hypothetical protein
MASSTEASPGRPQLKMTRPGPRMASSASSGALRSTTVRSRRGKISSGRAEMPNALNQCNSSSPY